MKDETPSQYPKQVPMAVPIRVPSRCGVKALLRAETPLTSPHPGFTHVPHHHILSSLHPTSAPPPALCPAYDNGVRSLHPMEEDSNQCEDQHEGSVELTGDFLSVHNTFRLGAGPGGPHSTRYLPGSAHMPFPSHLGEADHLDRDHGLQEPRRGEESRCSNILRFWRAGSASYSRLYHQGTGRGQRTY